MQILYSIFSIRTLPPFTGVNMLALMKWGTRELFTDIWNFILWILNWITIHLFSYFWHFREKSRLSDVLKSKHEENEAYLSEIEVCFLPPLYGWAFVVFVKVAGGYWFCFSSCACKPEIICFVSIQSIGQAYDDMQTQNQHLMQQITERDDYNIKVISLYHYSLLFIHDFRVCFLSYSINLVPPWFFKWWFLC